MEKTYNEFWGDIPSRFPTESRQVVDGVEH